MEKRESFNFPILFKFWLVRSLSDLFSLLYSSLIRSSLWKIPS